LLVCLLAGGCSIVSTPHRPLRLASEPPRARSIETSIAALADPHTRAAVRGGPSEVHPEFTLAFVEFDDQGRFWNRDRWSSPCGRSSERTAGATPTASPS
jgi:hypothetical protein